ncbi:MAG: hypothetical protein KKF41_01840 [Actinobacteria bacterium]|nr:hypothetical protein [Actinomycetota bacterium]MBU1942436.1 hypothetical protein [Actinomycetota bacterium]MBU2686308.1 hypothetical protein [Actinomycetota bacterium]
MRKTAIQVSLAVALLAALASAMLVSWRLEGMSKVDNSVEIRNAQRAEARSAEWALALMPKLQELEGRRAALSPGTAEYERVDGQVTGLGNLIASKVPSVAEGRDTEGNAVLKPTESIFHQLVATSSAAAGLLTPAERMARMPAQLWLFTAPADYLDDGWWAPELSTGNLRFTRREASLEIKNDPSKPNLAVSMLWLPPGSGEGRGSVYINGRLAGTFRVTEAAPEKFLFPKPTGDSDTLKVRIVNENTVVPDEVVGNGDKRRIGVAVEMVWQE